MNICKIRRASLLLAGTLLVVTALGAQTPPSAEVRAATEREWEKFHEKNHLPASVGFRFNHCFRASTARGEPASEIVRFSQTFHGIPVTGSEGILLLTDALALESWRVPQLVTDEPALNPEPGVSATSASEIAVKAFTQQGSIKIGLVTLAIYRSGWEFSPSEKLARDTLVWTVGLQASGVHTVFIDAHTGEVLYHVKPSNCFPESGGQVEEEEE